MKSKEDPKDVFVSLLGEDRVEDIIKDNWVEFSRKMFSVYKTNEVEIQFFQTDGKGDDVIHCSICYNEDRNKWYSQNCIDYPYLEFDTFDGMKKHLKSLNNKISNNGFSTANLR